MQQCIIFLSWSKNWLYQLLISVIVILKLHFVTYMLRYTFQPLFSHSLCSLSSPFSDILHEKKRKVRMMNTIVCTIRYAHYFFPQFFFQFGYAWQIITDSEETINPHCRICFLLAPKRPWSIWINSFWPSDAIWRHRFETTLVQVMVCWLTAPIRYLNQCWFIIIGVL